MEDSNPAKSQENKQDKALEKATDAATMDKERIIQAATQLEPPEQADVLSRIVTSISMQGPFPDPIRSKVTGEHISAAIEGAREHDERQFLLLKQRENRRDTSRWFALAVFFAILVAVGLLCAEFKSDPELLKQLLSGLLGFGAGALAGYGYGQSKRE